jgi:prepilin-type processing-associated H-X9-DG protein
MLSVTVVVGILAALLLPALVQGRISAVRARCAGNLRQLAVAATLYWDDNRGNCFPYGGTATNGGQLYWFGWIASGAEGQRSFDYAAGALYPYLRTQGVELCPAFNYLLNLYKAKAQGPTDDYGYNLSLSSAAGQPPINFGRITAPAGTALLADAAQINTWETPASRTNPMIEEWYYVNNDPSEPNGHFRHARKAEAVFCDGHVTPQGWVPGSIDPRLPALLVAWLPSQILNLP